MEKKDKYTKLLNLLNYKQQLKEVIEYATLDTAVQKSLSQKDMQDAVDVDVVFQDIVNDCYDIFTDEELDMQIAFYGSPAGQSILKKVESAVETVKQSGEKSIKKALVTFLEKKQIIAKDKKMLN